MSVQLGFFTRVLDDAPAAERYRLATEQIAHAQRAGFDGAAVAQHHFDGAEGGLPSPLPFLAAVAAQVPRIRLATGVVTLGLEDPVRVAEDAIVTDLISGGRLELGLASGGSPASFGVFGQSFDDRHAVFAAKFDTLLAALRAEQIGDSGQRVYPTSSDLADRIWLATFSEPLAVVAGKGGHGLMLSRTQPRSAQRPEESLADVQNRLIDAYLAHLPAGVTPRISVARTVFVADDRDEALRLAGAGHRRSSFARLVLGEELERASVHQIVAAVDAHVGTAADVTESLSADSAVGRATHLSFQVHSIDPPHEHILRSISLLAAQVGPALGWSPAGDLSH